MKAALPFKKMMRGTLASIFHGLSRLQNPSGEGVRILCYHRIHPEKGGYLSVHPDQFSEQMEYLQREGYKVISLADAVKNLKTRRSVILTFDDGYQDNFTHAFPVLQRLGYTATIFLISERLGAKDHLSLEEVQMMHQSGIDFGSHTQTHPDLPSLPFSDQLREISDSKKILEEGLGFPIRYFCYPSGLYNQDSLRAVRDAGYAGACSNRPGINRRWEALELRRTEIAPHDRIQDFRMKLEGAYDLLHAALHLFRGRP